MADGIMISTYQRSRHYIGFGENIFHYVLLRLLYLFAKVAGFGKQCLALFPFCCSKVALVFMCHIAVLGCLLFQPLYFFSATVCGYLAVKRQFHLPLVYTCRITHTNYVHSFIRKSFA